MRYHAKLIFLINVLLLLSPYLYSQFNQIQFDRIPGNDALDHQSIYCMLQGQRGFMWFGTMDGLYRYDGYQFVVYKYDPADSNSLSHNWIQSICQGDSLTLWVGTLGRGLNRFDPRTGCFTRYKSNPEHAGGLAHNNITALLKDSEKRLWVGSGAAGFHEFDSANNRFIRHPLPLSPANAGKHIAVRAIFEDRRGGLWIGTTNAGLFHYDRKEDRFTHYEHDPNNPHSLSFNTVSSIYEDRFGTLWIGTGFWPLGEGGGLNRLGRASGRFTRYSFVAGNPASEGADIIHAIREDSRGNLWVGTYGGGLRRFDRNTGAFVAYRHQTNDPRSLASNHIMSLYEDRAQNMWIGTADAGASKISPYRVKFRHYRSDPAATNRLSNKRVWALCEDRRGILWVGTQYGLNRLDRQTGQIIHYFHDPDDPASLSNNVLGAILEDRFGELWVGTDAGLARFDRRSGKFIHYQHDPTDPGSLSDNGIFTIYEDRQGTLWIGTRWGGLNQFDRNSKKFTRYTHDPQNPNSLSNNAVMKMVEGDSGIFWIATFSGGLNKFDRNSNTFTHYQNDPHNPNSLSHNTVESIHIDTSGILWLATWGGLNRFDPETESFERFTVKDGLPDNTIWGILEDGRGDLWLSTNKGLSRFTPQTGRFRNYDASDGLQGNEFSELAYYKTRRGELLFGGANGFNLFHPDSLVDNPFIPPVVLTDFKLFNETARLAQSITTIEALQWSYRQNFFSFEFAALDFTHPPKNQYAYRLKGVDPDWVYSTDRRFANYTDIQPGEYVFQVKGSNNDGLWNDAGVSLKLTITPPFWQTGWFRVLMIAMLAGLLYGLHRYRLSRLLEIERMRTRIASDLHDDIGSTLTRIAIYSELIRRSKSVAKITQTAGEIGALSREIITTLSDVVWSIDARYDTLGNLLDRMRDFAAGLFSSGEITLKFTTGNLNVDRKIPAHVRQNIYLIFKEALNNIAKHAGATEVRVDIREADGLLRMTIQDNGRGFDAQEMPTGNGLKNMQLRAGRIGAGLTVTSDHGVSITLTTRKI